MGQVGNVNSAGGAPQAAAPAQAAGGGAHTPPPGGGMFTTLVFFGVMILFFYLLIFRPQQKRAKKHQEFLNSLRQGDRIITSSGIYGTIVSLTPNTAEIEVSKNVRLKILKNQIAAFQATSAQGGAKQDMKNIERG